MNYQIECDICAETCWVRGWLDGEDVTIESSDIVESDPCEHIMYNGPFSIIDQEEHFDED